MSNVRNVRGQRGTQSEWMAKAKTKKKPEPNSLLNRLSEIEQASLYEFLRTHTYVNGCVWLQQKKDIAVSPSMLCRWWSWYASRELAQRAANNAQNLASELKDAGFKVTQQNLDDWTLNYFQRQAALGSQPDVVLKFFAERKRLELQERHLVLEEKKFERLKQIEEEARKTLTSGDTEADMVKRFKEILGFNDAAT